MRGVARLLVCLALAAAAACAQDSPREIYRQLNALRVDPGEVYLVRDLHLRRGEVRLALLEGKLALLHDYQGRLTGAVYTGSGRALVMPNDPAERRSLVRFLSEPILDQGFGRAYFRFTDDTGEVLRRLVAEEGRRIHEPSFVEEWDAALGNLNPRHSLRILADLVSDRPRPYFYAGLAGDRAGIFDVLVDARRAEPVLAGQGSISGEGRYYNVWASFAPDGWDPPAPPFTTEHIAVDTVIHPDTALEGLARITLKATTGGERMVSLELSRHLRLETVADEEGRDLPFFQNEEVSADEILQRGNDSVFVVLSRAPGAGEEFRLQFRYRGHVIGDAGNGVYFVGARGSWYPHVGGSDHFATFALSFRWPSQVQLVATGRRVVEEEEGPWRYGRWESEGPVTVAGFNLSDYAVDVVDAGARPRVELYANKQLEQALAARLRARIVVQPIIRPLPGQPRKAPHPAQPVPPPMEPPRINPPPVVPSPAAQMKDLGRDLAAAIHFYEKIHGPFPFERLAITQIPGWFGQSWPGLLYLSTLAFLPPEVQRSVGVSPRSRDHFSQLVPFHELAHQWWGNVVGWSTYRDQWIIEGLANYLAVLFADSRKPHGGVLADWLDYYRNDLLARPREAEETNEQAGPLTLGYRLRTSETPEAYVSVAYGKGTWVWHMLHLMLRDPAAREPDARFHQLLRNLLANYRYRGLTNHDLRREVETLMTPAMDLEQDGTMEWFFEQWVRATGIPHYAAKFDVRPQGRDFVVRGTLLQSNVPATFTAAVPIYALRPNVRPVLLGTVITLGPETPFEFTTRIRPTRLQLDPEQTLLRTIE